MIAIYKILVISIIFSNFGSSTSSQTEDIVEFVSDLSKKATANLEYISKAKNETNDTEIIEIVQKNAVDSFSQSAQIMRLNGIKDIALPDFILRLVTRLNLPEEHKQNVTMALIKLSELKSSDWQSYKFIYNKSFNNSSCNYVTLLGQHLNSEKKSNWIYSTIDTHLNKTDILIIINSENGSVDKIDVIKKPQELNDFDLDLMLKFFDAATIKAFSNYLGIKGNSNDSSFLKYLN